MRAALAVVLAFLLPASAAAADWRDYLKKPLTPGSVILLVEHAKEPAVVERWRAGVTHADPRVRAAAARVINVTHTAALVPVLASALKAESDSDAGIEQMLAVVTVGGNVPDREIMSSVARLGTEATRAYARALIRVRGTNALITVDVDSASREVLKKLAGEGNRLYVPGVDQPVHSIGDVPSGSYGDVLKVANCSRGGDRSAIGARVVFDGHGRAQAVEILNTQLSSDCLAAFRALFLTAFDSPRDVFAKSSVTPAAGTQVVVAFPSTDFASCLDAPRTEPVSVGSPTATLPGRIAPPKKTRDVKPRFPSEALKSGTSGLVIVESIISTTGCVQFMQVMRSPDARLSIASLEAIGGWRFEPSMLDGVPRTVLFSTTLTYNTR